MALAGSPLGMSAVAFGITSVIQIGALAGLGAQLGLRTPACIAIIGCLGWLAPMVLTLTRAPASVVGWFDARALGDLNSQTALAAAMVGGSVAVLVTEARRSRT
ncbi:hypothetical protein Pla86_52320 [Planctomycetes bacterium Pla86]|uniref:Uncharacterized protein n=2 Tax=Engelhardtia mirabilis TaxID=2528011 RepID=A0A518BT18_9BACT|nr:hypothetical protein Pla133_52350 [Planctomycetes bacterium Pla133]QDV04437.1 hypothetical protein Pla86_52320 [Planctomycetes bacterium Pla86]